MNAVNDVSVEISVVLGTAEMQIQQLLKMGRGAVIDLDAKQDDPVLIYANNQLIAKGKIVVSGDKISISVLETLSYSAAKSATQSS